MQIKIIAVPIWSGELQTEELNTILRSKKIIQVEQKLVDSPGGAAWTFCIKYVEDFSPVSKKKNGLTTKMCWTRPVLTMQKHEIAKFPF